MKPIFTFTDAVVLVVALAIFDLWLLVRAYRGGWSGKGGFNKKQKVGNYGASKRRLRSGDELQDIVAELGRVHGVLSASFVTTSGVILGVWPENFRENELATAELLTMYGFGRRITKEFGREKLEHIVVSGKEGFVLVESMESDAVLIVTVKADAQIEQVAKRVKRAAGDADEVLSARER